MKYLSHFIDKRMKV